MSENITLCAEELTEYSSPVRVHPLGHPRVFGSEHIGTIVRGAREALHRLLEPHGLHWAEGVVSHQAR